MSTHGLICRLNDSNKYESVWCDFDNYLSSTGQNLLNHFTTNEMVDKLFINGDLRAIYENGSIKSVIDEMQLEYNKLTKKRKNVYINFNYYLELNIGSNVKLEKRIYDTFDEMIYTETDYRVAYLYKNNKWYWFYANIRINESRLSELTQSIVDDYKFSVYSL